LAIICEEPNERNPERTFWIKDLSTNGSWLNRIPLQKGNRVQLKDDDEILIINDELADGSKVSFGFRFNIFNIGDAPLISEPPPNFIQEFRHKVLGVSFSFPPVL
jgi:hypothetical protein